MLGKAKKFQMPEGDEMEQLKCPICGKRAVDIDANGNVNLALKCPNCHNIVTLKYAGHRPLPRRRAV